MDRLDALQMQLTLLMQVQSQLLQMMTNNEKVVSGMAREVNAVAVNQLILLQRIGGNGAWADIDTKLERIGDYMENTMTRNVMPAWEKT